MRYADYTYLTAMGCCESKDEKTNVVTPTDSVKNLKRKTRSESSEIVPEKPETPKKPKSALPKRRRAKEVKPGDGDYTLACTSLFI